MKYIKLSIAGICLILMAHGCNPSKGHPGIGFIPTINDVLIVSSDGSASPYKAGIEATLTVAAKDEGTMKTLLVTEYYPADSETPYQGPDEFPLTGQDSNSYTFTGIGPITLSGQPGDYRMDVQIVDTTGGKSNIFSIDYSLQ
jgi:hypothetical protein